MRDSRSQAGSQAGSKTGPAAGSKAGRRAGSTPVPPRRRRLLWRLVKWGFLLGTLGALLGALGVAGLFFYYGRDPALPNIRSLDDWHPKVTTRILSSDGKLIGEVFAERRTVVPYDKLPPVLIHSVLCAEDAEFFEHGAINPLGIARAFVKDVLSGHAEQGGSTITQQVVKTMLLSREKTVRRKVEEILLAYRLEKELTKQQILAIYLNQIDFGGDRYGVEEASRYYFGKDVWDVDLSEAAMLASLPQAPESYSPRSPHADLVALKARQKYVLDQMVAHGYITQAQDDAVAHAPIRIVPLADVAPYEGSAPEVVDEVTRELEDRYGPDALSHLGATVTTTVDTTLEAEARQALEQGLRQLDARDGYDGPSGHLRTEKEIERTLARLRAAGGATLRIGHVYQAVVTGVDDAHDLVMVDTGGATGVVAMADNRRYDPHLEAASVLFKRGDLVHVSVAGGPPPPGASPGAKVVRLELGPQAAMVVIDPRTRAVLALVGGYGFQAGGFDRALHSLRQPGSSFKPILYATAFATGKYTPATIIDDAPQVYDLWRPENAEAEFRGPVRLRVALASSINTVAIQLMSEVGTAPVIAQARAMGIESPLTPNLSLALGSSGIKPIESVDAYACFDDGGQYLPPRFVDSVAAPGATGAGAWPAPPQPSQALPPAVAYLITSVLESTLVDGTAAGGRDKLGRPAAGKTGTTNREKDAWFVGYTPDLVTGVWVGFDDSRVLGHGEYGARAAFPIWLSFMEQAEKGRPVRDFSQPGGITVARIDPASGLLATPGAPDAIDEDFLDGTAPTETAPPAGTANAGDYVIDQQ